MEKKIKDFIMFNLYNSRKFYHKNSFIIQDIKSIYAILKNRKYKREINGLTIVPTTFCNANCNFCAKKFLKDKKEPMSFGIFKKAVDEWKSLGKKDVGLVPIIGEIFMDSNFPQKVEYLSLKKFNYEFCTNGLLLNQNIDLVLNSNAKSIIIDLGDINPQYDSEVFGISKEMSKKRTDSIVALIRAKKERKSDIKIILGFRSIRTPKKILKDLKKTILWNFYKEGLFFMDFHSSYDNWGGTITKKYLKGYQTIKIPPKIKKIPPKIKKIPCERLSTLAVLPNGNIRACDCRIRYTFDDEMVLGNIKSIKIKDVLESREYNKIIKNFQQGKLPEVCKECSFYQPKIN